MAFGEVEEGPFTGLLRITNPPEESVTVRVFKRFGVYRVETLDGELVEIRQHLDAPDAEIGLSQPAWSAFGADHVIYNYSHAIVRRELSDWQGDNFHFTRPTGPARATTWLDRPCWEVELTPPDHDTSPLVLTIDTATGMQFRARSRHGEILAEWLEIEFDAQLDDSLFSWDGDTISSQCSGEGHLAHELHELHEAKQDKRDRKWLKESGVGRLRLRYEIGLDIHELNSTTGEFEGSITPDHWTSLGRRRLSDAPWEEHDDCKHEVLWTDGEWQWRLRSDGRIRKRTLKHLRRQTRKL